MSPNTSKKIGKIAENLNINMETFKPGYVHPRFQVGEAVAKDIGEPTELLLGRLLSLEEKKSEQLGKTIKEMENETSRVVTFKEFIIKMTSTEPDGLMNVKQMKIQIAELKQLKDESIKKEDFKAAGRYKLELEKLEASIKNLSERLDQLESEINQLSSSSITSSPTDKDYNKMKIEWRTIMKTWLEKELN